MVFAKIKVSIPALNRRISSGHLDVSVELVNRADEPSISISQARLDFREVEFNDGFELCLDCPISQEIDLRNLELSAKLFTHPGDALQSGDLINTTAIRLSQDVRATITLREIE